MAQNLQAPPARDPQGVEDRGYFSELARSVYQVFYALGGTTNALQLPQVTTAERDAIKANNGMIVYNTTTNAYNFYENGSWVAGSALA